ncbi:restriction endonuclease subunit S [Bifidobacterium bifidum]|uniref:restriction endonuclease subunit S n=1 Tax=Bifidobacterium bifidum TaxID=1681 RepID=UPI003B9DAA4A
MTEQAKVPAIRFAGFTDPWEQRKLGELYEKNDERNTFGLGAERTLSIATMTFNSEGNGADASSLPNYKVIRVGDAAFEGHSNKSFAYGRFVVNAVADGIMSPRFSCLRPKNSYPVRFWKYYIHSEQVMRDILVRATKSGTMMNELVIDDLFKQSIAVPQEAEQQAIGYFFSHLDTLITLHQRKYDKLVILKKSMLEKMFPKDGESVPEIRFAGFTDPWEQRKFSDIVDVCSGKDYKHLEEGPIPVYGTGGFMTSVDEALSYDRDAVGIGRKGTIDKPYLLKAPFWTVDTLFYAIPKSDMDLEFVHCSFLNVDWKSKDESTGLPSLSKEAINETIALVPSFNEQSRLGEFFSDLDSLITLHQRKLELLRNIKKSLLDKMFV